MPPEQGQDPTQEGQDPAAGEQQGGLDPKAADAELARARADAAKYRTQLREVQEQLAALTQKDQERADAEKSELQRANERVSALEHEVEKANSRVREASLRSTIVAAAVSDRHAIIDPDAAYRLLDTDAVEWDGDKPTNVDDLLTTLAEQKPYLKRAEADPPKVPARAGRPATSPTNPASGPAKAGLTRAQVDAMTPDEINDRYDEVMTFLATEGAR